MCVVWCKPFLHAMARDFYHYRCSAHGVVWQADECARLKSGGLHGHLSSYMPVMCWFPPGHRAGGHVLPECDRLRHGHCRVARWQTLAFKPFVCTVPLSLPSCCGDWQTALAALCVNWAVSLMCFATRRPRKKARAHTHTHTHTCGLFVHNICIHLRCLSVFCVCCWCIFVFRMIVFLGVFAFICLSLSLSFSVLSLSLFFSVSLSLSICHFTLSVFHFHPSLSVFCFLRNALFLCLHTPLCQSHQFFLCVVFLCLCLFCFSLSLSISRLCFSFVFLSSLSLSIRFSCILFLCVSHVIFFFSFAFVFIFLQLFSPHCFFSVFVVHVHLVCL